VSKQLPQPAIYFFPAGCKLRSIQSLFSLLFEWGYFLIADVVVEKQKRNVSIDVTKLALIVKIIKVVL